MDFKDFRCDETWRAQQCLILVRPHSKARHAEVAELDFTLVANQYICWLDISVEDFFVVHEFKSLEDAVNDVLAGLFSKKRTTDAFLHVTQDVSVLHIFLSYEHPLWAQKATVALDNEWTVT